VLVVAWMLFGLIGHDPWKPDEARYFGVVLEFLRGGDWVVPTLAGEPFVEKPPLFYALARASPRRCAGRWSQRYGHLTSTRARAITR
jgi:4-amino-4-deoxy-L-arabinose transferase-like glycosyltransferase